MICHNKSYFFRPTNASNARILMVRRLFKIMISLFVGTHLVLLVLALVNISAVVQTSVLSYPRELQFVSGYYLGCLSVLVDALFLIFLALFDRPKFAYSPLDNDGGNEPDINNDTKMFPVTINNIQFP
jgi:hypothetical protein